MDALGLMGIAHGWWAFGWMALNELRRYSMKLCPAQAQSSQEATVACTSRAAAAEHKGFVLLQG